MLFAADHPGRREYWVGVTTAATLAANAVAPGIPDRYLARTGFSSQQTGHRRDPDAPVNLWDAADGPGGLDFGTWGIFTGRSHDRDPQLWASHHHGLLAAAVAAGVVGAVGIRRLQR